MNGFYDVLPDCEVGLEVYSRIEDTQIWKYQTFENIDEIIEFDRMGFILPLAAIDDGIAFDETSK